MSAALEKLASIHISPARDLATLRLAPGLSRAQLTEEKLSAMLDERGLVRSPERDASVRAAIRAYFAKPHEGVEVPIVRGVPATHGINGHLDLTPEVLESLAGQGEPVLREDGGIEHRARSSVAMVKAGTRLGRLISPIAGCDGTDVFGFAVAARDGVAFKLEADDSIVVGADGWLVATRDGVIEHHEQMLRVTRKLVLREGIDFGTGNVDFPGDVRVERGIADCFVLRVGGNLHVRDLVDAATLDVAGSVVLEHGMAGRGIGTIRAGKDVFAAYLTQVRGTIARDAAFETELADCDLRIGRHLRAPRGTLLRGDVCVGHETELATIGSDAGVATTLRLGWMQDAQDLAKRLHALSQQAIKTLDEASATLGAMSTSAQRMHADEATRLHFDRSTGHAHVERMARAYDLLSRLKREHTLARLVVHEAIHPGTLLHLETWSGAWVVKVQEMLRGPFTIGVSPAGKPIVQWGATQRTTPLEEVAIVSRNAESVDMDVLGRAIARAKEALMPPAKSA